MARKASALVVTLDEAAELLLTKVPFIRREIREGAIKAVRLGNQTMIRRDELKEYLQRKEAEGIPARKHRTSIKTNAPESTEGEPVNHDDGNPIPECEPEISFEIPTDIRKEIENEDE